MRFQSLIFILPIFMRSAALVRQRESHANVAGTTSPSENVTTTHQTTKAAFAEANETAKGSGVIKRTNKGGAVHHEKHHHAKEAGAGQHHAKAGHMAKVSHARHHVRGHRSARSHTGAGQHHAKAGHMAKVRHARHHVRGHRSKVSHARHHVRGHRSARSHKSSRHAAHKVRHSKRARTRHHHHRSHKSRGRSQVHREVAFAETDEDETSDGRVAHHSESHSRGSAASKTGTFRSRKSSKKSRHKAVRKGHRKSRFVHHRHHHHRHRHHHHRHHYDDEDNGADVDEDDAPKARFHHKRGKHRARAVKRRHRTRSMHSEASANEANEAKTGDDAHGDKAGDDALADAGKYESVDREQTPRKQVQRLMEHSSDKQAQGTKMENSFDKQAQGTKMVQSTGASERRDTHDSNATAKAAKRGNLLTTAAVVSGSPGMAGAETPVAMAGKDKNATAAAVAQSNSGARADSAREVASGAKPHRDAAQIGVDAAAGGTSKGAVAVGNSTQAGTIVPSTRAAADGQGAHAHFAGNATLVTAAQTDKIAAAAGSGPSAAGSVMSSHFSGVLNGTGTSFHRNRTLTAAIQHNVSGATDGTAEEVADGKAKEAAARRNSTLIVAAENHAREVEAASGTRVAPSEISTHAAADKTPVDITKRAHEGAAAERASIVSPENSSRAAAPIKKIRAAVRGKGGEAANVSLGKAKISAGNSTQAAAAREDAAAAGNRSRKVVATPGAFAGEANHTPSHTKGPATLTAAPRGGTLSAPVENVTHAPEKADQAAVVTPATNLSRILLRPASASNMSSKHAALDGPQTAWRGIKANPTKATNASSMGNSTFAGSHETKESIHVGLLASSATTATVAHGRNKKRAKTSHHGAGAQYLKEVHTSMEEMLNLFADEASDHTSRRSKANASSQPVPEEDMDPASAKLESALQNMIHQKSMKKSPNREGAARLALTATHQQVLGSSGTTEDKATKAAEARLVAMELAKVVTRRPLGSTRRRAERPGGLSELMDMSEEGMVSHDAGDSSEPAHDAGDSSELADAEQGSEDSGSEDY